jgi:hypothetical protein
MDFQQIFKKSQFYSVFGSYVYNQSKALDIDVCLIDDNLDTSYSQFDTQTIKIDDFKYLLSQCDIKSLECLFSPHTNLPPELIDYVNWDNLRSSISQKASHSFVKAKKKFIDKEIYIGQKSLFHSLRILMFGIQLSKHHKIVDFSEANIYFDDIMNTDDWNKLNLKYKPIFNRLNTEFRKVCPKSSQ